MSKQETREHARLIAKWARGLASAREITRCIALDVKAAAVVRIEATFTGVLSC